MIVKKKKKMHPMTIVIRRMVIAIKKIVIVMMIPNLMNQLNEPHLLFQSKMVKNSQLCQYSTQEAKLKILTMS